MKQKIIWFGAGFLAMCVIVGVVWLGKWYGGKNFQSKELGETPRLANLNQNSVRQGQNWKSPDPNINTNYSVAKKTQDQPEPWKSFKNTFQNYTISYPGNGKLVQLGTSGRKEDVDPTDGSCISIKFEGGYVTVLGKTRNQEITDMCLRTGVGTDWSQAPDIQIETFGKKYTASGMQTASASLGYKEEFYYADVPSGEKIEFGIEVNEKYAPEITYEEAKKILLKILKNLKRS